VHDFELVLEVTRFLLFFRSSKRRRLGRDSSKADSDRADIGTEDVPPVQSISRRYGRIEALEIDETARLESAKLRVSGLTLCMRTRADSTGPKGEKICNKVDELVVPGMLPIQMALVGRVESSA
jgi:hypothetical protein